MNGNNFIPENAFQQWTKDSIEHLETLFTNHLKHHDNFTKFFLAPTAVGIVLILIAEVFLLFKQIYG